MIMLKLWWCVRYGRAFARWYEEVIAEAERVTNEEYVRKMSTSRWANQFRKLYFVRNPTVLRPGDGTRDFYPSCDFPNWSV